MKNINANKLKPEMIIHDRDTKTPFRFLRKTRMGDGTLMYMLRDINRDYIFPVYSFKTLNSYYGIYDPSPLEKEIDDIETMGYRVKREESQETIDENEQW